MQRRDEIEEADEARQEINDIEHAATNEIEQAGQRMDEFKIEQLKWMNLNILAFVKLLKKFDKSGREFLFQQLTQADDVDELFLKHFFKGDKRKIMTYLQPTQRRNSHPVIFLLGLFTGFSLALGVVYILMAHITGMYIRESNGKYMEIIFPFISIFSLLFLHFFIYGCNIVMWTKTRINYRFILELSQTKPELKANDVFLICFTSIAIFMGVLLVQLILLVSSYTYAHIQIIPGFLFLAFLLVLVCPFNIIYKSTGYCFISVIGSIVFSPLCKVVMMNSFMTVQLCSQFQCLEIWKKSCVTTYPGATKLKIFTTARELSYAVSFLPYFWKVMQCLRRWLEERQKIHLANLGKHVSTILAAVVKVVYNKKKSPGWLCIVLVVSSAVTFFQLYWDFVIDWGLLWCNSKNRWLGDELMLRKKFIYFISMVFIEPCPEHLHNAGKFKAVKMVPLPFHEGLVF
ncbi:hypothetical protein OROHE_015826 [Orobanche hederae]